MGTMPPPKKPKSGPTCIEAFLDKDELSVVMKCPEPARLVTAQEQSMGHEGPFSAPKLGSNRKRRTETLFGPTNPHSTNDDRVSSEKFLKLGPTQLFRLPVPVEQKRKQNGRSSKSRNVNGTSVHQTYAHAMLALVGGRERVYSGSSAMGELSEIEIETSSHEGQDIWDLNSTESESSSSPSPPDGKPTRMDSRPKLPQTCSVTRSKYAESPSKEMDHFCHLPKPTAPVAMTAYSQGTSPESGPLPSTSERLNRTLLLDTQTRIAGFLMSDPKESTSYTEITSLDHTLSFDDLHNSDVTQNEAEVRLHTGEYESLKQHERGLYEMRPYIDHASYHRWVPFGSSASERVGENRKSAFRVPVSSRHHQVSPHVPSHSEIQLMSNQCKFLPNSDTNVPFPPLATMDHPGLNSSQYSTGNRPLESLIARSEYSNPEYPHANATTSEHMYPFLRKEHIPKVDKYTSARFVDHRTVPKVMSLKEIWDARRNGQSLLDSTDVRKGSRPLSEKVSWCVSLAERRRGDSGAARGQGEGREAPLVLRACGRATSKAPHWTYLNNNDTRYRETPEWTGGSAEPTPVEDNACAELPSNGRKADGGDEEEEEKKEEEERSCYGGQVESSSVSSLSSALSTSLLSGSSCRANMMQQDEPALSSNMQTQTSQQRDEVLRQCVVCNDLASGYHYGVWSCEGCKAFFKRNLNTTIDYVCPATNTCTIDKQRRKSCQACRLRKCFDAGMSKTGNRRERNSGCESKSEMGKRRRLQENLLQKRASHANRRSPGPGCNRAASAPTLTATPASNVDLNRMYNTPSSELPPHLFVRKLEEIDLPLRYSYHVPVENETELTLMTSLITLADRELRDIVMWAKSIPGYNDLSLADRIGLVEHSWMQILIWGVSCRTAEAGGTGLIFAPDFIFTSRELEIVYMTEIGSRILGIAQRITRLGVHKQEQLLMRALILFNGDTVKTESEDAITSLRHHTHQVLEYECLRRRQRDVTWLMELIGLLTHVRLLSSTCIDHLFELHHGDAIPIAGLVHELLLANTEVKKSPQRSSSPTGKS